MLTVHALAQVSQLQEELMRPNASGGGGMFSPDSLKSELQAELERAHSRIHQLEKPPGEPATCLQEVEQELTECRTIIREMQDSAEEQIAVEVKRLQQEMEEAVMAIQVEKEKQFAEERQEVEALRKQLEAVVNEVPLWTAAYALVTAGMI